MEDHLKLKKNAKSQWLGTYGKTVTVEARSSVNLPDWFKQEKSDLSNAGFCHEIKQNVEDILPEPSGDRQKQQRKAIEEEELVKYMSNLPSYLERGRNHKEKVLNVGVLNWAHLEKWHCNQKQVPHRSSRISLSSSDSSSPFSTEGSSLNFSRGQNSSPGRQRNHHRSLQFHLMSSPMESHSEIRKPFKESIEKFQHDRSSQTNIRSEKGKFTKAGQTFVGIKPETKPRLFDGNDFDPNSPQSATFDSGLNYEPQQGMKTNTHTQDGEFMKKAGKLLEEKAFVVKQDGTQKKEVLTSRGLSRSNHSQVPHFSNPQAVSGERAGEANRRTFSDMPVENFHPSVKSDVPHSCPLPKEMDGFLEVKCSTAGQRISALPGSSFSILLPGKTGTGPSCSRTSEDRKLTAALTSSRSKVHFVGSDLKPSKAAPEKARSTSPFRRLSMGMGKISKSFSSKDGSSKPQLSSTNNPANSGSDNSKATFCPSNSSSDTQSANGRAKSSPLRRLLDPMLKSKAPNCRHSGEPQQRGLISAGKPCKSSDRQFTGAAEPTAVKFDVTSFRRISGSDLHKECRPSTFQALLRVAFKNGQPLFTFAVDNEYDILAATMKKLSTSREDEYNCIYNFFAFHEVKKKNGRWMNQAGKNKGNDYVQNVVAQLKVSGSQFSNSSSQNYIEQSIAREFVLFSVALHQSEQQTLDFQPKDELAAIVLKIAKVIDKTKIRDGNQNDRWNDLPARRLNSTSTGASNQPSYGSQSLISTTVILPSGIHSLPTKGGPSSLIQRWRSGGSCDCGGWDLGCELRILANQNTLNRNLSLSKTNRFEFITQGGEQQDPPVFSLAPFKDGIYSVEFNSSLSTLQAFSLCIAVLDGKKLWEAEGPSDSFEEYNSLETVLASQSEGIKAPNGIDGQVPARYVSYPPLSPAGRV